jgi:site-specific recombinase XerD
MRENLSVTDPNPHNRDMTSPARTPPAPHPDWSAAFSRYAGALSIAGRSPRTLRTYRAAAQRLAEFLGPDCPPAALDGDRLLAYFVARREAGVGPATLTLERTALRLFLTFLAEEGRVPAAAVRDLDRIKDRRRRLRQPVFLSVEEAMAFLAAVGTSQTPPRPEWLVVRDKLLFRLLLTTGMRISEALSLTVDQADQAVRDGTFRVVGKGDKERFIPLEAGLEPLVRHYLRLRPSVRAPAGRRGGAPLFVGRRGAALGARSVQALTGRYAREAGILGKVVTPHKLRHTFATTLLRETQNLRLVQELLGHESLQTTQIYTHVLSGDRRAAVDGLPYARRSRGPVGRRTAPDA